MKQDVYEHLAKTFIDKKVKQKPKRKILWILAAFSIICVVMFLASNYFLVEKRIFSKSLYLLHDKTPIVIKYDFTSLGNSKVKALSFNLDNLDLSGYHFLTLSIRTEEKTKIDSTIKVQIENSLLEKDAEYISGINSKWRRFVLPLADFKLVKDWSQIKTLTFMVEDWNVTDKNDKILIDEVRFTE
ncbi:MAG: hypothetical protein PHS93_04815 [Candidatus Omnitrophica bacterium]|nr:hypothetical protein [Candidatus Omnitrophota bacterium]MDD5352474.1 hypothetical protein [Candidatus Omnitrophota bacterium]MDD5550072.1 hypothetical protein [Candidatus Omnitrophota bacterium]